MYADVAIFVSVSGIFLPYLFDGLHDLVNQSVGSFVKCHSIVLLQQCLSDQCTCNKKCGRRVRLTRYGCNDTDTALG